MRISKSNPLMKDIVEMDRLFHNFSLIEKLMTENGIFYVYLSEEKRDGEYVGGNSIVQGGEITDSMSGGYLGAYKRLLPEIPPYSDDGGARYILRANRDELRKMKERMNDEILEIALSEKRGVTLGFLKKLTISLGGFSGSILKEGIPSILEFIPLLYENCEDIEMHFSYEELGKNMYEVSVGLSYAFKEKKQILPPSPYLEYDKDTNSIIFSGRRLLLTRAEVRLFKTFIEIGKHTLETSEILETIDSNLRKKTGKVKLSVKKRYIYNVRAGLNKNLASIFGDTECVYMVGRNGMLHFRFPEFIQEK